MYLVVIIQTLPQVQGIHSRANLWKGLGQVVFDIGILRVCANGMLLSFWEEKKHFTTMIRVYHFFVLWKSVEPVVVFREMLRILYTNAPITNNRRRPFF